MVAAQNSYTVQGEAKRQRTPAVVPAKAVVELHCYYAAKQAETVQGLTPIRQVQAGDNLFFLGVIYTHLSVKLKETL